VIVKGRTRTSKNIFNLIHRIKPTFRLSLGLLVLVGIIAVLFLGFTKFLKPRIKYHQDRGVTVRSVLLNYYYRLVAKPDLNLDIDVSFNNWEKIRQKRDEAIVSGVLLSSDDDFVTASIRYRDREVPVRMRLKGDWADHFDRKKWSLRLEVKGDQTFLGMDRFSLQAPETRENLNEWLFLKALADEGVIALKYDFVHLNINGQAQGIYALEEHFSKYVLERNKRREGPILKFDEDFLWEKLKELGGSQYFNINPYITEELFNQAEINVFGPAKIERSEDLRGQYSDAYSALNRYLSGELSPKEVFDYSTWSKYLALADLFGASHGLIWHNLRFYWNPISARLEPVPFDSDAGKSISKIVVQSDLPGPLTGLMSDIEFLSMYRQELVSVSTKVYIEDLLSRYKDEMEKYELLIKRDNSNYVFLSNYLINNSRTIEQLTTGNRALKANVNEQSGGELMLELVNVSLFPIEVLGVRTAGNKNVANLSEVIPPSLNRDYQRREINLSMTTFEPILVEYRMLGEEDSFIAGVDNVIRMNLPTTNLESIGSLPGAVTSFALKTIDLPIGTNEITRPMMVPEGYTLQIGPATTIEMSGGASIISYGNLNIKGNKDNLVKIHSLDGSGGLITINAKSRSEIEYAEITNLGIVNIGGIKTTGAITLYNSDVSMDTVSFSDTKAEDMLNIVLSDFSMEEVSIGDVASDAIDVDFGNGSIWNSKISRAGNDCVDFSGSMILITGLTGIECGDKAVSAGENSEITVKSSQFRKGKIGLASKDLSRVILSGVSFDGFEFGLTAYQKKPEFGPGYVEIDGTVEFGNILTRFMIEKGSVLVRPQGEIKGDEENLGERFE